MSEVEIIFRDREVVYVETESLDTKTLVDQLNAEQPMALIGNQVVESRRVARVRLIEESEPNVVIETIEGAVLKTNVTDFDALAVFNELNNEEGQFIAIGNVVMQKDTAARVYPITAE